MKQNKYEYVKVIQGQYYNGKWEDVDEWERKDYKLARVNLKAYRECKDGFAYRMINRRSLISATA
jgi:hypothetical protein